MAGMFKNPVAGAILRSSGAIPVRRNPNKASSNGSSGGSSPSQTGPSSSADAMAARATLFAETTKVLRKGGVVGIFPEGGSYTGWRIFQVLPGAAWCGVEHARSLKESVKGEPTVVIVPTVITYTDKAKYRSRVHVRYGEPISLASCVDRLFDPNVDSNVAANAVAKEVTAELERRLVDMSVDAPDWETICAAKVAKQIIYTDEDTIPLSAWVKLDQRLAKALNDEKAESVKASLVKYYSLLYHAGIKHSILQSFAPDTSSDRPPHTLLLIVSLVRELPLALARFVLFLPPFLLFSPGYITGILAGKTFGNRVEEETQAQFKAVGAGFGIGANALLMLSLLWRANGIRYRTLSYVNSLVFRGYNDWYAKGALARLVHRVGFAYLCVWILAKWHNLLINSNYKELQKIQTWWKLVKASFFKRNVDESVVEAYTKPIHPPVNPFIRKKATSSSSSMVSAQEDTKQEGSASASPPVPIDGSQLVSALLRARKEAVSLLSTHLPDINKDLSEIISKA